MSDKEQNANKLLAESYGFSRSVRAGGLIFFSGQVGMETDGSVPADPETQYRLAFAALDDALAAEGVSPRNLVELLTFHANYPSHMEVFMKVKTEFLNGALPTWTAIGAAALGTPETLLEIKAIAAI